MLYLELLEHRRKWALRSLKARYPWFVRLGLGITAVYVVFVLGAGGYVFTEMLRERMPGAEPAAFVNGYLLPGFLTLFLVRFFLQQTPMVALRPYLALPIQPERLIRFFQVSSLASLHNLFPLLFLASFWLRHFWQSGAAGGGVAWLASVVLVLLLSQFANVLVRAQMGGSARALVIALTAVGGLIVLDQAAGTAMTREVSAEVFGTAARGEWWLPGVLAILTAGAYAASGRVLRAQMKGDGGTGSLVPEWRLPFLPERGPVVNLMVLELKLMWRNKRPRVFFLSAVILGGLYVGTMLLHAERFTDPFSRAVIGVFASGMFVLNYGQMMFSWESSYFDGVLARAHRAQDLVRAKLLLLQLSAVAFFLLTLPFFVWLQPSLLPYHAAFLFYNAGVTSVLVLALAILNQRRVDLSRGGMLLNYEGFSLAHFLWFIPTLLPPALLLYATAGWPAAALGAVGGLGVAGLLASGLWQRLFAGQLARRKHVMAAGFRGE